MKRLNLTIVALLGLCVFASGVWAGGIVGENNWNAGSSFNLQVAPDPGTNQPSAPVNPEMKPVQPPWNVQPVPPPDPGYGGADRKPIRWFMRPNRPSQQGS